MSHADRILKVLAALHDNRITEQEADAYLRHCCETTLAQAQKAAKPSNKAVKIVAFLLLISISMLGLITIHPTTLGNVVLELAPEMNNDIAVNVSATSLHASGELIGEGNATLLFRTDTGDRIIASITSDPGTPRLDKPSYLPGEQVNVEHATNATYYLDDGAQSTAVTMPFAAPAIGEYTLLIVAESTTRLPLFVTETPLLRTTPFTDLCAETCTLNATNGTIIIVNTTPITIGKLEATTIAPNTPPTQKAALPNTIVNESITLNLSDYFIDAEDQLLYSTSTSNIVNITLDGDLLTLTPIANGEEDLTVYASDLQELVPATLHITAIVPAIEITNASNETAPNTTITEPTTNATANETAMNTSLNTTLDCSSSNPNTLAEECLLLSADNYFPDQDIVWQNLDRVDVARFTVIGNLLLKGTVVEHSTATPGSRDFRLGYPDQDSNTITTVWIESATGNLHTTGRVIEENANLLPPPGSYSLLNKRNVYLAYVDLGTGDVHIRGNVIPYRRSFE